jgi:hypothetical protein
MRVGLGQLFQSVMSRGYPRAGIDWIKRHRLPLILIAAVACWALLLAFILAGVWYFQAATGNFPA